MKPCNVCGRKKTKAVNFECGHSIVLCNQCSATVDPTNDCTVCLHSQIDIIGKEIDDQLAKEPKVVEIPKSEPMRRSDDTTYGAAHWNRGKWQREQVNGVCGSRMRSTFSNEKCERCQMYVCTCNERKGRVFM